MDPLDTICELSHEFGAPNFVKGGGGNTSVKNPDTLWVKPSGTTLSGLMRDSFVIMNRQRLGELYDISPPENSRDREELVKTHMLSAVVEGCSGRPSVEAPLHDSFSATFVVHTHPTLVNGLTCAKDGAAVCRDLFPDALWMDYIDPGYTLCMDVRKAIGAYAEDHGHEPDIIFLKNHGVFVAGDTADIIREHYGRIMDTLSDQYSAKSIPLDIETGPAPDQPFLDEIKTTLTSLDDGYESIFLGSSGLFNAAQGPLTPDHIVYAKAYSLRGAVDRNAIESFRKQHGYLPKIFITDQGIISVGTDSKDADLALLMTLDGAQIVQLAEAFGGVEYMTERATNFIDNWEVEAFRRTVIKAQGG